MPRLLGYLLAVTLMLSPVQPDRSGLLASAAAQQPLEGRGLRLAQQAETQCGDRQPASETTDPQTTSTVPSQSQFIARDYFRRAMTPAAEVKITWLGATFTDHFVPKIEPDRGAPLLRSHAVRVAARDIEIIAELGARHETTLGDLWCLLKHQANGEAGILRTDAKPNVLYIRSVAGLLFTVDALWGGAGWELGASSVEGFRAEGVLIISR